MWDKLTYYINKKTVSKSTTESFLKLSYLKLGVLILFCFPFVFFAGMSLDGKHGIIGRLYGYGWFTLPLTALVAFFLSGILFIFKSYKISAYVVLIPFVQLVIALAMLVFLYAIGMLSS